jgi:hypothetical protein
MKLVDNVKISLEVSLEGIPYQIDDKTFDSITYLIMKSLKL